LLFLFFAEPGSGQNLQVDTSGQFVTFTSPYMVVAFAKGFPMMAYFNVESGGRSRRLLDKSLLRSGLGGTVVCGTQNSFGLETEAVVENSKISYLSIPFENGKSRSLKIEAKDERTFEVEVIG